MTAIEPRQSHLPTVEELAIEKPHLKPVVVLRDRYDREYVLYALQPKQMEAFGLTPVGCGPDREPFIHIGYGGAAYGGKSVLARTVAAAVALQWPGSSFIIFRETDTQVKRNHVDKFLAEVPEMFDEQRIYKWNGKDMCATWYNGSKTYFGYLKHEKDVFQYQGPAFDGMCFEEATFYSWFQVNWLVGNRLRATVDGVRPFALYPSNPGNRGMFWYKRLFIDQRYREDERAEEYTFVQSRLKDNVEGQLRDPSYERKLDTLPEPYRSWQRDGNFSAGAGQAFSMLDWRRHIVKPFQIPAHWIHFGSFDWGYAHPFSFGHYVVNEDGTIYKVETVTGHHLLEPQKIERIKSKVPWQKLKYIVAGHDCWAKIKARGEDTPTVAEQWSEAGMHLTQANIDRKMGAAELRRVLDWTASGPIMNGKPTEGDPRLMFFDTPNNRRCFEQFEAMVADPSDLEDVLKVDADDFGQGGDDFVDECVAPETLVETDQGPRRIVDLVGTTGLVYSAHGQLRRYSDVRQTQPRARLCRLTFVDGRSLDLTWTHPVLLAYPSGGTRWVPVGFLRPGDRVVDVGALIRHNALHGTTASSFADAAGVSRPDVLADEARLLSSPREVAAPRGMGGELRDDSGEPPCSPPGPRSGEQPARELGCHASSGASKESLDARYARGRESAGAGSPAGVSAHGSGMARLAGGAEVPPQGCERHVGEGDVSDPTVPTVRQGLPDAHPEPSVEVLPRELQSEGATGTAEVVQVEAVGESPVYNMEVDTDHCYAVAGGILVHNCRYAVTSRPMSAQSTWSKETADAWAPETLQHEYETTRRSRRPSDRGKGPAPEAVT